MREILRQNNLDLLREINRLELALSSVSVLPELSAYHEQIIRVCEALRQLGQQNLRDLDLNKDEILPDILSQTQNLTKLFRLYDEHFASPILRSLPSDRLCLRVIAWLHANHPVTQDVPAAVSNGGFSIWPEPRLPVVYFMPSSRQHGLLYLPLFFHEFGHLLYACHELEMNNLVCELQKEIASLLKLASLSDDAYAQENARRRRTIVATWYVWTQEIFCDMVGFTIGGPCFARAFSMYLRVSGRDAFHLPERELESSRHPVTWLRIRLLADQARQKGWAAEADALENEWHKIAATMGIEEYYYGFYDDRFLPSIRKTIEDMLTEASPYQFSAKDVSSAEWDPDSSTPVHLLNRAWAIFLNDPSGYESWEEQAIARFLASTESIEHERTPTN
jgi:hypothetical protein